MDGMQNWNIIRRMVQVFMTLLLQGVLLFVFAGTLAWTWAWVFLGTGVAILVVNLAVLPGSYGIQDMWVLL